MLDILRRIVQEVSSAPNLDTALGIIVHDVRKAMNVTACSVYLAHELSDGSHELVLLATRGLEEQAVGKTRLTFEEGLIGLVAQRAEPLNLEDALQHPHFCYIPGLGEDLLNAFLGVPVINYGRLIGVLVIQDQKKRRFEDEHVAFLVTLAAQLAGAITQAGITGDQHNLKLGKSLSRKFLEGLAGSPGVVEGVAVVVYTPTVLERVPDKVPKDIEAEIRGFYKAVSVVQQEMRDLSVAMKSVLPAEECALFEAFAMMLDSGSLIDDTIGRIRQGNWAAGALRETIYEHTRIFREMTDPYLRDRADDIRDLGRRVIMKLQSKEHGINLDQYPENTILVGDEITAIQLAEVPVDKLRGVVSAHGSSSSHVAILANAMQVPAVMGVTEMPVARMDGKSLIVDGYNGRVYIQPGKILRKELGELIKQEHELKKELSELQDMPAETQDGTRISLFVNIGLLTDVNTALTTGGAEGVGLYRTEIPFQIREKFPGEEEQTKIYRDALQGWNPRPVVLRTLDIGGDKTLDYFPIKEENPFLGWRGIRISLDHPDIFLTQVRAMLKASEGLSNLQILLPMISGMKELRQAMSLIHQAHSELLEEGLNIQMPPVGIMIEVPSSVYLIGAFARHVDFLSIGSNDLTQYLLAVDRNNERVGKLYDSFHPSVLSAILHVVQGAYIHKKPVSICGEMAGDPLGALLLMGMGLNSLSMNIGSLLRVKRVIRSFTKEDAINIMSRALTMEDGSEVRSMLRQELEHAGLGGLIRPGK